MPPDSDHTDKPSSDDEPSSLKNNDDSTDVNTIAEDQDENPQPLTPLEAAGAEAVTDNIPKRSSPVRQGFGKAYIEATIHDKTIRGAKLTIDDKTYWSSVEIEAFAPDLQKVEVTAEYLDEHHVSYRGRKSFTIDWVGRQKIQVEMAICLRACHLSMPSSFSRKTRRRIRWRPSVRRYTRREATTQKRRWSAKSISS